MAESEPREYSRQHLVVSDYAITRSYGSPNEGRSRIPPRDRLAHADRLANEIAQAQQSLAARAVQPVPGFSAESAGALIQVDSAPSADLPNLARSKIDVRIGNVRSLQDGTEQALLVMPEGSLQFFANAVADYREKETPNGWPVMRALVEPIENFRASWIEGLWTDSRPLPEGDTKIWWECWCWPDRIDSLRRAAAKLHLRVSEGRLYFPEMTVLPIYASRLEMERIISSVNSIGELRCATDSARFYTHTVRDEQRPWVDDLSSRVERVGADAPAVCLLDSGVNREHPLLEGSLSAADTHTYDSSWGTADDRDHGTYMAGLALFGDLTALLSSTQSVTLRHHLESVKLIEPPGFIRNDPENYGVITQGAIAVPEIAKPNRLRTYCLSITNDDVSGERPSSWSSAIDQSAAGVAPGDNDESDDSKRLIIVSAGNVPDDASVEDQADPDEYPIEDPGQSWNAMTIGGFTDLVSIEGKNLNGWQPLAEVGDKSPYSRASTDWPNSTTPIKPELVFEAGNRAISPSKTETLSGIDSLSLLSTSSNVLQRPLDLFWATSAATAQAGRMAAMIQATYPTFWPETVRALMVHSAQWSPAMEAALHTRNKSDRKQLLRCFGYGIANLDRAINSAKSDLALVSQASLRPFQRETGKGIRFNDAHFYELPWPIGQLEQLGNTQVQLKITLSYFVEPNPGQISPVAPERYRSVGLRFAIKRAGELAKDFQRRVNRLDREEGEGTAGADSDSGWMLGRSSISAGSLHSDVWTGPAVELADRRYIAITPVIGWWRERQLLRRYDRDIRYGLVVSIATPDENVDLYSEVAHEIQSKPDVDIEI